jgi:hypothetical protein
MPSSVRAMRLVFTTLNFTPSTISTSYPVIREVCGDRAVHVLSAHIDICDDGTELRSGW